MEVWQKLRGAWDDLNQANRRIWDDFYGNNPTPVSKMSKSTATTGAGRANMAAGMIINTLIDEKLKKPQAAELEQARKNFKQRKDRADHFRNGGQLVHPPSVEM